MKKKKDVLQKLIAENEKEYNKIGSVLDDLTRNLEKAVTNEDEFNSIFHSMEECRKAAEHNRDRLRRLYEELETAKLFDIEVSY